MKNKCISTKIISKNELFKNTIIISSDDLKEKLQNIIEIEKKTAQSNIQYSQMFNDLFEENKFKIRNDFDRKHCNEFLKEKDESLKLVNLDDSLSDDDEESEVLNRISSKFTFGHY